MIDKQTNKTCCKTGKGTVLTGLIASAFCLFLCLFAAPASSTERIYVAPAQTQPYQQKYVQPRTQQQYRYKYVAPRNWYGQRRSVPNAHEAGKIMAQYYPGFRVGPVIERDLFYQADVRDARGVLVDKVIIDKRTGRMRSIY